MEIRNYLINYLQNGEVFHTEKQVISMMGKPLTDAYAIDRIKYLLPDDAQIILIYEQEERRAVYRPPP